MFPGLRNGGPSSLAARLFISATILVVVILFVTGIALSSLYQQAVERSFDRRLNLYLRTLIAEIAPPEDADDKGQPALGEPLFELPLSGWYWQVVRIDGGKRADPAKPDERASRSLWDRKLPKLEEQGIALSATGVRIGYVAGPEDQQLRVVERLVDFGSDGRFIVTIAGDATEIFEETRTFDFYLSATFVALTFGLLLSTLFQVRFGLAPLKRITTGLLAIRSGTAERLDGDFPVEIAPLARETNALLDANREIVERARTHVGNLAHAEATAHGNEPFAAKVLEQASIMRDQVGHHLERARIAARLTTVTTLTEIAPVIDGLHRTMEKIHRDRDIEIEVKIAEPLKFRGEKQDLEEMVGNLVDNACKWAQSQVQVEVRAERTTADDPMPMVRIIVDDDGRGLTAEEQAKVARRGQRLDETKPGSGLGLSIVTDLARLYRGNLTLGAAPIGGLRAELVLPAI
jgi:signal transduction histidine kinase